ncbi:DUF5819 family protein [Microbacterium sp. gxy059]|uniref:DUF5819 family protein n=1 Tax=Microbacterium sp. gxy059 TaxID=2957199 RepID=UPI003D968FFF
MTHTPPAPSATRRGRPLRRIVLVVLSLLTAWHIFATFLWVAPDSHLRDIVPGEKTLSGYMLPMFGQGWSVFAPSPVNGDYRVEVRAAYEDETGEVVETDWVDATAVERSRAHHHLAPSRSAKLSIVYGQRLYKAYGDLDDAQKEIVGYNYFKDDWETRQRDALEGDDKEASGYIRDERRVIAYATQVAYAVWGEQDFSRVQVRVSRQAIVPFDERDNPDYERKDPIVRDIGWRAPVEREGQSRDDFASYFCSAPLEVCE